MFTNDIEDAIKSQFIYDPSGEVTFSDVKSNLFNKGFEHLSTNVIFKAVKRIIPEGKNEKRIVHGGNAYYCIRFKDNDDHKIDMLEEELSKSQSGEGGERKIVEGSDSLPF